MKKNIHFHSDCSFFAGCENMLVNFFHDEAINKRYRLSFSYRYSPRYEAGVKERIPNELRKAPLKIFDMTSIYEYINNFSFKPLRLLIKILANLLLLRYIVIFWNTIVLYRLLRNMRIDLLHVNNGGYPGACSCTSIILAAKLCQVPQIVYVVNNLAVSYKSPLRWLDYPLDKILVNAVSMFVTGSAYAKQRLIDILKVPTSKAISIHNGIARRSITENRIQVLKRLGVDHNNVIITIVAVLEERKGHIILLKAIELLKDQGIEKLPIILIEGIGPTLSSLKLFVDRYTLQDHVKFIGSEKNVFNLMNASDIIVLPSLYNEDFPNIISEAMSLGKPVIASRLAGTPEQIESMHDGILLEPGNVEKLAEAIRVLLADSDLRLRLGVNALEKFEKNFSNTIATNKYLILYNRLLKEDL
ncbi:MAG: glycosyltransferase family 4 protein [Veillonellales bacterium]